MNLLLPNTLILSYVKYKCCSYSNFNNNKGFFDEIYIYDEIYDRVTIIKSEFMIGNKLKVDEFKNLLAIKENDNLMIDFGILILNKEFIPSVLSIKDIFYLDFCAIIRNDDWVEYVGKDNILKGISTSEFRKMYQTF